MSIGVLTLALASIAQPPAPAADKPTRFVSKDGGFSIMMPGTPTVSFQKEASPSGDVINKIFQVTRAERVYSVICTDPPGNFKSSEEEALLNGVLQGYTQSTGGTIQALKKVQVEGRPGREVTLKLAAGNLHSRYFLKDKRIYQVVQFQTGNFAEADFARFADTFRTAKPVGNLADGMEKLSAWHDFASKEGGFRVKMIGEPKEQLQKLATAAGPVEVHLFLAVNLKGENFGVSYNDVANVVPAPKPEALYDQALAGIVKNLKGKLGRRKAIEYDGQPGVEAEIGLSGAQPYPDAVYLTRIYWLNDRIYQVIYVGPRAHVATEEVRSFLDSFRLDDPKKPEAPGEKP